MFFSIRRNLFNSKRNTLMKNIEEATNCEDKMETTDVKSLNDEIIDKRKDGVVVYYYVKRKFMDDFVYEWQLEGQLQCSKTQIEKFNKEYDELQKLKNKKRGEEKKIRNSRKNKLKERILPCACVTDSPFNPNRSFRGSVCDF